MDLKSRISRLCKKKGITLKKLALLIEISEQTLHKNFKRGSMETKYLEKMAEIFGITPSEILDLKSEPNIVMDPEIRFRKVSNEKDYTSLLEELREVNRENRDLNKHLRELEDEIKILKTGTPMPDQKSKIRE